MRLFRAAACALGVVALGGCAAHRTQPAGESTVPLEAFIQRVRELTLEARPARTNEAVTIERTDPALTAARLLLTTAPTAANYRLVAGEYVRLGVLDAAYDHYSAALRLNSRDAEALAGLARIWRDWNAPERGLTLAYRAIAFAPALAGPRNTLGTLLVALQQPKAARAAFERALAAEPDAAYILNNLCYAALLDGDRGAAVASCRRALDIDPELKTARNNLALVYAAAGDLTAASREFLASGDAVSERYNMGVALFATHRYAEAAAAFDAAADLRPSLTLARHRARQARGLAATNHEE